MTTPIYIGAEPLHRIGEYADEVSFATGKIIRRVNPDTMQPYVTPVEEDPPVPFPTLTTAVGSNTITVGTTVQPSVVSITGHIKPSSIYGNLTEVKNQGDKIKKGEEEKIFERFYRSDESHNRDDNRYGLGLAIAKNICNIHNAKISAFSDDEVIRRKVGKTGKK